MGKKLDWSRARVPTGGPVQLAVGHRQQARIFDVMSKVGYQDKLFKLLGSFASDIDLYGKLSMAQEKWLKDIEISVSRRGG